MYSKLNKNKQVLLLKEIKPKCKILPMTLGDNTRILTKPLALKSVLAFRSYDQIRKHTYEPYNNTPFLGSHVNNKPAIFNFLFSSFIHIHPHDVHIFYFFRLGVR